MSRLTFLFIIFSSVSNHVCSQNDSLYLWPNAVPFETRPKSRPVPTTLEDNSIRVIEVTDPFLAVFEPTSTKRNGKAMVVCPGGGYIRLAVHKEGYTVANWLTGLGYTVFVLQYRVPDKREGALHDLQRSLRIIRQKAKDYEIETTKIGAIGFSAGAHLVASAGMLAQNPPYPFQDDADKFSSKPDGMILIYPAYLDAGSNLEIPKAFATTDKTADTFIFQTMDDGHARSALALATALQKSKANVELHMLPTGGHGYGMDPGKKAAETWPKLLEVWLKEHL